MNRRLEAFSANSGVTYEKREYEVVFVTPKISQIIANF